MKLGDPYMSVAVRAKADTFKKLAVLSTAAVAALFCGHIAHGQGFMVRPMRVQTELAPGEEHQIPIEVKNTVGNESRRLDVTVVDLTQHVSGGWSPIMPDAGTVPGERMSCRTWIDLDTGRVDIPALATEQIRLRIKAPAAARGTYIAGLLVQSQPIGADDAAVRLQVRFLIPIIIGIQGRPVRQNVTLQSLGMQFQPRREQQTDGAATTAVVMHIANEGRTFSRIRGAVRVEIQRGDRWLPVTRAEMSERFIIPGVTLSLTEDLHRRLPSGHYRLRGTLYVDGRRVAPLEAEIPFEGDPQATLTAFDAALVLDPESIDLNVRPGAVRTTVVNIENPAEEPLVVRARAILPKPLQGMVLGELRGDALSAADWVQIRPSEFTLPGGRSQNVRLLARIPRHGLEHSRYYAELMFQGNYQDGQSAGITRSMLVVANEEAEAMVRIHADRLALAKADVSRYVVQARFSNTGNVHIMPRGEVEVLAAGGRAVRSIHLSGDDSVMLPLGVRLFSEIIDFDDVEPGPYILQVRLRDGGVVVSEARAPIHVETEDSGRRVVTMAQEPESDVE